MFDENELEEKKLSTADLEEVTGGETMEEIVQEKELAEGNPQKEIPDWPYCAPNKEIPDWPYTAPNKEIPDWPYTAPSKEIPDWP